MFSKIMTSNIRIYHCNVTIIGGGIGGCVTALRLAEAGIKVTLIEKEEKLLSKTSNNTPGRMGVGFHYLACINTAKMVMESTIRFIQKNPGFILGEGKNDYLRNGYYFITKDSLIKKNDILKSIKSLKQHYIDLVKRDPAKRVLGSPEKFYRILEKSEYSDIVNIDNVYLGIKTQESLLDWPKYKKDLINKINSHVNITVLTHLNINGAHVINQKGNFILKGSCRLGEKFIIHTPYVVNASWENIESINQKIGLTKNIKERTNRLKLLVEVALPEELLYKNSMFFCVGPHAMFSNMGNGKGRITYAPITNYAYSTEIDLPIFCKTLLTMNIKDPKFVTLGNCIIDGVSKYIPAMKKATLLDVLPGIVKSEGEVNIYDPLSDFHHRNYKGVTSEHLGWINNACMKLFYCEDNASEVLHLLLQCIKEKTQKNQYTPVNMQCFGQ